MAEEAALQALDMVNLSNELYKIETGNFRLEAKPVELAGLIRRIAELQRRAFAARNLTIAVATPSGVDDAALGAAGDAMLCYSLFQNLAKNACEAAPEGSTVTLTLYPGSPRKVTVVNRGVVPAEIRERFFEKFVTAGKAGGTGLGTYSARLLAEAQNGGIAMESLDERDETTITVTLPAG